MTERSPKIKVIIITGYATIEVARETIAKGAFDFIAKPFKPNELREIILKLIQVFINLILNAIDAMDKGSRLRIWAEPAKIPAELKK